MKHRVSIRDIQYAIRHQTGNEPIMLLHGFTGTHATWNVIWDYLAHYAIVAPDLVGHGETDAPSNPQRYAIDQAAEDLIAILDHFGYKQAHLLGYSMGGRLALYTAIHYPHRIKTLTLESASAGLAQKSERRIRAAQDNQLAEDIEQKGIQWFTGYWEALPLWESQKQLSFTVTTQLRQERLNQRPKGLANSLRGMGTGVQPALWDQLPTFRIPTHLIVGELDHKFVQLNQKMLELLPNAHLTIIKNAGHCIHLEQPKAFIRAFIAHL